MSLELVLLLFVIVLCCAAEAEETPLFGMGRRHYFGEGRLDIKYTTEVATPHIDWAEPYVNGPIKAFVIPSVMEGRTLVELMERLSMEVDAVTIDPAWDVNKWTLSFGEAYGARSEQNADGSVDYGFTYKYLEEDLTNAADQGGGPTGPPARLDRRPSSDRTWDVMIMHGILGWENLPQTVRDAILRRVKDGMGLVIVGPLGGEGLKEISPLAPADSSEPSATQHRQWRVRPGEWQAEGSHYITDGVPLETLPSDYLGHGRYALTDGASLLATANGDPVIAARELGKGRVVALGYQNYGLAPYITWDAYGKVGDSWWETWYSLFIRATVWAARKEPSVRLAGIALDRHLATTDDRTPLQVTASLAGQAAAGEKPSGWQVAWQVRSDRGDIVLRGDAALGGGVGRFSIPLTQLAGDRYLLDVFLVQEGKRVDWATAPFELSSPVRIAGISPAPTVVEEGRPIEARVSLSGPLPPDASVLVELVDNYQRVIARETSPDLAADRASASSKLESGDLLTHIGWVRASLWRGTRRLDQMQTRVDFATPDRLRRWDDFEVNVPFYGPQNYYHWMPLLDEQYRRCGVTWLMEPERNFRFTVLAQPSGLGVYHYHRKPFDEQMNAYWETGDRRYLERNPCLHRDWRETSRRELAAKVTPYLRYRPFHYYLYDEPSLTSYTRAFEFCFTPETRAAFRQWLRKQYRGLTALNAEWGTSYTRWEEIEPVTADEARGKSMIPAWVDFRRFMDITFAEAFEYTQEVVNGLDPGGLTLVGGTQMPTPFNGTDWWLLSRAFGILEPYSGIPEFRSFNPELPIIQACGYADAGPEFEEELWRRALQGQRGATVFWNYTMLDPDLALNSQGLAMERAFGALRGRGIARLLLGARRDDSRIAILYSQPSLYAAWIQDGEVRSGRSRRAQQHHHAYFGWEQALHSLGLQYRCISYEQLAKQGLDRREFDLLILPDAIAMSAAEVANVRRFMAAGGVVVSDVEPGAWDEHGKKRSAPELTRADGVQVVAPEPEVEDFAAAVVPGLKEALAKANVKPPAKVSVGSPQLIRFVDGAAEYVAVEDAPAEPHRVDFDHEAHIYDVRERRYLGKADGVESLAGQASAGRARVALYALLPEPVGKVEVQVDGPVRAGAEVTYHVAVNKEACEFRHVFAVRVCGPDGRLWHMYDGNLDAARGKATGSFRLAWNDPLGEWRVVASDAATGVTGEARFTVKE